MAPYSHGFRNRRMSQSGLSSSGRACVEAYLKLIWLNVSNDIRMRKPMM